MHAPDQPLPAALPHEEQLHTNAIKILGNVGIDLASAAPTATMAVTLAAILAASAYASPIAILIVTLPMLAIAAAYRKLNQWRVHCGTTYDWGARAISPTFGFTVGWIILLAWLVGAISIIIPLGPYAMSLVGNPSSRIGEAIVGFAGTLLVTVIAYLGIKLTAKVQWTLLIIEFVGIGILTIMALVAVFTGTHGAVPFRWSWFSWHEMGGLSGFIGASLIVVYMFSGWDIGATIGEETSNARKWPGTAVMVSVVVLALMYALMTFAFQAAAPKAALEAHANALQFIAQRISGTFMAKYIILAVALSAVGSCLACFVAAARIAFAMGSDGVLPRIFGRTHRRFKSPIAGTALVALFTAAGVWIYPLGSSSVQSSFATIVAVDGILFALFYAGAGISVAVYYRRLAARSLWNVIQLEVFPLAAVAFLLYMVVKSVPGLGGWTSGSLISLYVMLGIGLAVMVYVRAAHVSEYFSTRREVYDPEQEAAPDASQMT